MGNVVSIERPMSDRPSVPDLVNEVDSLGCSVQEMVTAEKPQVQGQLALMLSVLETPVEELTAGVGEKAQIQDVEMLKEVAGVDDFLTVAWDVDKTRELAGAEDFPTVA
jgi:hypothetical protein